MDQRKKEFLEAAGWRCGTVAELLGLTPEEELAVELRIQNAQAIDEASPKDEELKYEYEQ